MNKVNDFCKGLVVFIDDEAYILQTLKAIFRRELKGYNLHYFVSGQLALQFLDQDFSGFEGKMVVLSDWLMPGMKGDELLINIRRKYPQSKNFLLSGMINKSPDTLVFEMAGIVRVIQKPWENDDLLTTVMGALE